MFVSAGLLHSLELTHGDVATRLVIPEKVLASGGGLPHQSNRFFAKLITAERYIIPITEGLALRGGGTATDCGAEPKKHKCSAQSHSPCGGNGSTQQQFLTRGRPNFAIGVPIGAGRRERRQRSEGPATQLDCATMEQASRTFPTLRRWRGMSESEQDVLLDKIERRRRWRVIRFRAIVATVCIVAVAIGTALIVAR
jgi:hypothetical protein